MLNQLVEFGERQRKTGDSDALKLEPVSIDIVIDEQGQFLDFAVHEKIPTKAEALASKKGKARLLLDKAEEVLGFDAKKHAWYLDKIKAYENVPSLKPVLLFYESNRENGLDKAKSLFEESIPPKEKIGNLAFRLLSDSERIHEKEDVLQAIIQKFEASQQAKKSDKLCSICGKSDYPVTSAPHGMIKRVPSGQSSGSALVSYNEKAFESYGFSSNENASICSACARNYVEGLNYLLGHGELRQNEKGKGKNKEYFHYSNRKNIASDTALIFWTRNGQDIQEVEQVDNPAEHSQDIFELMKSRELEQERSVDKTRDEDLALILATPASARQNSLESVEADRFYACILSGAAARVAIRSWIETSASFIKANVVQWFQDISIYAYNFDTQEYEVHIFPIRELVAACAVHRKSEQGGQSVYKADSDDSFLGRAGAMLWQVALLGTVPPRTLLDRILRRIRMEEGRVTPARVALLRLILNRNMQTTKQEGREMQDRLDESNKSTAYIAGRIFAVLENIQKSALGKDLNATIRDRFFSSASTSPAATFGRLFKLSQHHLGKMRGEKDALVGYFDKQLALLCANIDVFPVFFSLEEQGQFCIGYYHERSTKFENNQVKGEQNV